MNAYTPDKPVTATLPLSNVRYAWYRATPRWKIALRLVLAPVLGALTLVAFLAGFAVIVGGLLLLLEWLVGQSAMEWLLPALLAVYLIFLATAAGYELARRVVR